MVSSQNSDPILEPHLQSDQQGHRLDRVVPSVDVVAHKEVVSVRRLTTDLEQLHQVMELTVDVSTDSDWALDWLYVALLR